MNLRFTKMQGAGNDFVVLDATAAPLALTAAQIRHLGDRRFGVGADQILVVERSHRAGVDFRYRIFNGATGEEVEHCGNGARCFVRFVRDRGLTTRQTLTVETMNNLLELRLEADGRVQVDMNRPVFDPAQVPFDTAGLVPREVGGFAVWPVEVGGSGGGGRSGSGRAADADADANSDADANADADADAHAPETVELAVLSMGNPHAVLQVADVDAAPVARLGPLIEAHRRFPRRVNVGFLQVVDRTQVRLRVWERGAGETLACGTGACAAVVAGIRLGLLDAGCRIEVATRGGPLGVEWPGREDAHVLMTGPAETVFEGSISV